MATALSDGAHGLERQTLDGQIGIGWGCWDAGRG